MKSTQRAVVLLLLLTLPALSQGAGEGTYPSNKYSPVTIWWSNPSHPDILWFKVFHWVGDDTLDLWEDPDSLYGQHYYQTFLEWPCISDPEWLAEGLPCTEQPDSLGRYYTTHTYDDFDDGEYFSIYIEAVMKPSDVDTLRAEDIPEYLPALVDSPYSEIGPYRTVDFLREYPIRLKVGR